MTPLALFGLFFKIGILTFGGGYAMIPLFQDELVIKTMLISNDEFANMVALAQMTPGPVGLNAATYIGYQQAQLTGALTATFGVMLPSLILMPILIYSLKTIEKNPYFQGLLSTIRPVTLGLIFAAVVFFADSSIFKTPLRNAIIDWNFKGFGIDMTGLIIFIVIFILNFKTKLNVFYLIILAGILSYTLGLLGI